MNNPDLYKYSGKQGLKALLFTLVRYPGFRYIYIQKVQCMPAQIC
jgi:hypothetical protein